MHGKDGLCEETRIVAVTADADVRVRRRRWVQQYRWMVHVARWDGTRRRCHPRAVARHPSAAAMTNNMPEFDNDEVALLITAVRKALERLKRANEAQGRDDPEFLEFGRRYSIILQKLETFAGQQQRRGDT